MDVQKIEGEAGSIVAFFKGHAWARYGLVAIVAAVVGHFI